MTQAQVAKKYNISANSVSVAVRKGQLQVIDGQIDEVEAAKRFGHHIAEERIGDVTTDSDLDQLGVNDLRRLKLLEEVRDKRLTNDVKEGRLIALDVAVAEIHKCVRAFKVAFEKVAPGVYHSLVESGTTSRKVATMVQNEIKKKTDVAFSSLDQIIRKLQ